MAITQIIATLPAVLNDSETFYEDIAERNNSLVTTVLPSINALATQANSLALEIQAKAENAFNAISLDTIEDLATYTGTGLCIVKDLNRGGAFIYDATQSAVNNGGTIFDGWVRQYSGAINVKWFGAKGDGITNDSASFELATAYALGGDGTQKKVYIPEGNFRCNFTSESTLEGSGSTYLYPYDNTQPILTLTNHGGSWQYREIKNINFVGDGAGTSGATNDGVGIGIAFDTESTGRYSFYNCTWKKFDIGFNRNLGNIGISFYSCDWEHNNIAIQCLRGSGMHHGNMYLNECQLSENSTHCVYFDADPAQVIFNDCIFEYNYGIWIFVDSPTVDFYRIRDLYMSAFNNCYIEGHGGGDAIVTASGTYAPSIITLVNSRKFIINYSNVGTVNLYSSHLEINSSYIVATINRYGESNLNVNNARTYRVSTVPFNSILGKDIEGVNNNYLFQMNFKWNTGDLSSIGGEILSMMTPYEIKSYNSSRFTLVTYNTNNKAVRLSTTAGTIVFVSASTPIVTSKKYIVTTIIASTNNDKFKVNCYGTNGLDIYGSKGTYVAYTSIAYNSTGTVDPRVYITPYVDTDILDIAQVSVVAFETYKEAINHINNPKIYREDSIVTSFNLEGYAVDFDQIHLESYLSSITGLNFENISSFTTKFGTLSTNKPTAINSNYSKGTAIRDVDGTFKWIFTTATRVIYKDQADGVRYSTLTA